MANVKVCSAYCELLKKLYAQDIVFKNKENVKYDFPLK